MRPSRSCLVRLPTTDTETHITKCISCPRVVAFAGAAVEEAYPAARATAAAPPVVRGMPRTKNVPRRSEGFIASEQQRAAAALATAPGPAPAPHHGAFQVGGSGASGVTVKEEDEVVEEEEEEETPEGQERRDLPALAPEPARVLASGPRAALAATPAPAPHHDDVPPGGAGAGASGVTSGV